MVSVTDLTRDAAGEIWPSDDRGLTPAERAAREFAALDAMIREDHPRPGDTRTCPGCGRPQHYTGTEHGWAHYAAIGMGTRRCDGHA